MRLFPLSLFLTSLISPFAWAGFTYADLVKLIKDKHVQSVEELTAALPPELQSDITFRLRPHNRIQKGPRAVRFTPNGRLILTHNDNPGKRGGRSVEVMEVSPSGNIQLHDISFRSKGAPVISSDLGDREKAHLQSCLACHGDPPRMIWPAYNVWPDSCGEKDDSVEAECLAFLKAAKTNPRFKDLKWDPANPAWPYYAGGSTATNKNRVLRRMPNTRFTTLVTFHNSRQMANVVETSPLFPLLKYNLIRQNRCVHVAFPSGAGIKDRLKKLLKRDSTIVPPANWSKTRSQYVEKIFADQEASEYSSADISSTNNSYQQQNRLTFLEFFGISKGNTGSTELLTKAGRTGIGFTGQEFGGDTTALMTVQLMNDLAKTDAKLGKFVEARALHFSDVLAPSPYYDPKIFNAELDPSFAKEYEGRFSEAIDLDKDLCGYLSEKAVAELDAYELQLNAGANVPLAEDKREIQEIQLALKTDKLKAGKLILSHEKCVACHDPGVGKPVGPYFPFRDERKFAEANRKEAGFDLSIVEKVERMISSETHFERRMPLNRPALSAEEREAIVEYLKSIAVPPNPAATSQKAKKRH